ncbi:hypothetical protein A5746_16695 [Mycolicibacterium conceptionense]|nr:hypothetical protein A5639_10880 [Mycolicibacterium conceptionense]OMB87797.1 hypothetical protein A5741_15655 [Mycolicibacterium conceptionense]OMB95955.1 hypothetical protein A5746_16695 [Mycolicibacterium conceptionense]
MIDVWILSKENICRREKSSLVRGVCCVFTTLQYILLVPFSGECRRELMVPLFATDLMCHRIDAGPGRLSVRSAYDRAV